MHNNTKFSLIGKEGQFIGFSFSTLHMNDIKLLIISKKCSLKTNRGKWFKASYSHSETHASLNTQLNLETVQNIQNSFSYLNCYKSQIRLPLFSLSR